MNPTQAQASIAVVVVNYNAADFLGACLDSIQTQSLAPQRVIVVDNASTDGSADIAANHEIGAELIRNTHNAGFAEANNQAIELASDCEWLALLNPDATADKHWLQALYQGAKDNPQFCSFASLQRVAENPKLCDGTGDCYHAFGYGWRIGHNLPVKHDLPAQEEVFASCAAACLIRRAAVERVGGFDIDYFCYGEDLDLGFRLRLAGERALFISAAEVLHHQSAIAGLNSSFSIYHGQRNLVWTYCKNMPTPLLVLCLLPHLVLNLLALVSYSIKGQHASILRAKRDALKGLPAIMRKRKLIQSDTQRISSWDLMQSMDFSIVTIAKRLASA